MSSGGPLRFLRILRWSVGAWLVVLVLLFPSVVRAQFLRLGPFDFQGIVKVDLVYSSNVEGERPSDADKEREDYYIRYGLLLPGEAQMSPNTSVRIDSGLMFEKHFVREDLDNESSPFAFIRADAVTELSRLTLRARAFYEKSDEENEEGENEYVPGGRKDRIVTTDSGYSFGMGIRREPFEANYNYGFTSERYDDAAFEEGDNDEEDHNFEFRWRVSDQWSIKYALEAERTEFVNDPEQSTDWKNTEKITIDGNVQLWRRPRTTYSLGLEKEDEDDEKGEWDPIQSVTMSDDYELSPTLRFSWNANYEYDQDPEEDDIGFTYGGRLSHELSRTALHALSVTREPVDTFGSSTETDSTTWNYSFNKADLFLYNLDLLVGVAYSIDVPVEGPEERTWDYNLTLRHVAEITPRLQRMLTYEFTREDSNLVEELLDEHRVTYGLKYEL